MDGLFVFLGTGASAGVPVIGCDCAICHSSSPRNLRLRSAGLIRLDSRSFLIDVGPDFRQQALTHSIDRLDGLLLTHLHYDHIAGIDDLRIFSTRQHAPIPCLLSRESFEELQVRYHYFFKQGTSRTAQFSYQILEHDQGTTSFQNIPISYCHYRQGDVQVTGFRIGNFAYITDIYNYEPSIFESLQGVEYLVLSALRQEHSHIHLSTGEAVEFARRVGARHTRLTHLSHHLDHEEMSRILPPDVQLGYDGYTMSFEV